MGLKSPPMDAETPAGGRDRAKRLFQGRAEESTRGSRADLYLGGLSPLHRYVGLGKPRTSPRKPMTSPNSMDVLGDRYGSIGTCGSLEKPKEG
jgi:hypothetical protein